MTEMTEINAPRLRKVLEHVTEHPEEYDQEYWCGTTCCVAGHTTSMAGWHHFGSASLVTHLDDSVLMEMFGRYVEYIDSLKLTFLPRGHGSTRDRLRDNRDLQLRVSPTERRQGIPVPFVARELLGLSPRDADMMFSGDATLNQIWRMAQNWTNGEVAPTPDQQVKIDEIDAGERD